MAQSQLHSREQRARRRRRASRTFAGFVAASVMLCVGLAAVAIYLINRPITLRVAVGPAGADDARFLQAMAQTFARERDHIRLALIPTEGPESSLIMLGDRKADLAVARADLPMPVGSEAVAILRKNYVVIWSVPRPGESKGHRAHEAIKALDNLPGHRIAVIGKTSANPSLLRLLLAEAGVASDKIEMVQYGTNDLAAMAQDSKNDAFMAVGPLQSKVTADAIALTARSRGEPHFLSVDVSEAIAQKHPVFESAEIPGSTFNTSPGRPDDKIETVSVDHLIVAPKSLADPRRR